MDHTYQLLDHTADLRLRVVGRNRSDLYTNAGLALFDLIAGPVGSGSSETMGVTVSGADPADLLVNYLRELLYLWTGEERLVTTIDILHISNSDLTAQVTFMRYDPDQHRIAHEIKAVTYHQVEVIRTGPGWQATVILDI